MNEINVELMREIISDNLEQRKMTDKLIVLQDKSLSVIEAIGKSGKKSNLQTLLIMSAILIFFFFGYFFSDYKSIKESNTKTNINTNTNINDNTNN